MTLKFAFESNERARWIDVLLGSEKMDELYTPGISKKKNNEKNTT